MSAFETWILLLQAARASETHDLAFAETCLRQALSSAEETQGKDSTEAGLCVAELAVFLRRCGQLVEAEELTRRYQVILHSYTGKGRTSKTA